MVRSVNVKKTKSSKKIVLKITMSMTVNSLKDAGDIEENESEGQEEERVDTQRLLTGLWLHLRMIQGTLWVYVDVSRGGEDTLK